MSYKKLFKIHYPSAYCKKIDNTFYIYLRRTSIKEYIKATTPPLAWKLAYRKLTKYQSQ